MLVTDRSVAVCAGGPGPRYRRERLRRWMGELTLAPATALPAGGQLRADLAEISALEKEAAKLRAERDILRHGLHLVASELHMGEHSVPVRAMAWRPARGAAPGDRHLGGGADLDRVSPLPTPQLQRVPWLPTMRKCLPSPPSAAQHGPGSRGLAALTVNGQDPWTQAMRRGDHARAWRIAHEILARRDPATRDDPSKPYHLRWVWDGRPLDGRDVLVRCYHGYGDTLQFARFLPLLAQRAASVTVEMQPRLLPLFRGFPGVDRLIPFDVAAPAKPFPCDIEIMELPLALQAGPLDAPPVPLGVEVATVPPGCLALCWQAGDWDEGRSIPEALVAPLCRAPTLTLVAGPTALPVLNPEGCPMDLPLTAGLVAAAALVVTVDTMAAHLAGTLGRPVMLLLKHDPDWRWPLEGDRTPWYPTMRILRQDAPGDWEGVIARAARAIAGFDAARGWT